MRCVCYVIACFESKLREITLVSIFRLIKLEVKLTNRDMRKGNLMSGNINNANILIVDDMPNNLELLTSMLDRQGYHVYAEVESSNVLRTAHEVLPDLILLDIMMPRVDGFEVCRRLKADDDLKDIPVVFISAIHDVDEKLKAFDMGGVDYITKPFKVREVLARVETQLAVLWHKREIAYLRQLDQARIEQLSAEVEQRKQAEKAAQVANETRGKFMATMSHELRTPLNTILGFAQLMASDDTVNEDHRSNLNAILRSGEHLLSFINDVLEISKIEAGRVRLNITNFSLQEMLISFEEMIRPKAEAKGLLFTIEQAENLPTLIRADEGKLRQVILNLLSNAIKFTSQGGVNVAVEYQVDYSQEVPDDVTNAVNTGWLFVTIQDTGFGIAEEEFAELFEPFVQTQSGQYSKQGSGLGLAISREFVRLMGGDIEVQSALGEGTKFRFYVRVIQVAKPMITKTPTNSRIRLIPGQPDYRVLIIEDHADERDLLARLMDSVGFRVQTACDFDDGFQVNENWQAHFVWMNVEALTEREQQVLGRFKQQQGASVVVALSATVMNSQREMLIKAGFDDFIAKPYHRIALFECMTTHLGVQFNYLSSAPPQQENRGLEPAMFANIPSDLIEKLYLQSTMLDAEAVRTVINEITPLNSSLSHALSQVVNQFQFGRILDVIRLWKQSQSST